MRKRKINWYIYREADVLKVRYVEMHEQETSRLATIAKDILYGTVELQVENAFKEEPPEQAGNIGPGLMFMLGMQNNSELREYIRDTIGGRTPEEYKPILIKQINDLVYQQLRLDNSLISHFGIFNRVRNEPAHFAIRQLGDNLHYVPEIKGKSYPFENYWVHDSTLNLTNDKHTLLEFLGCLDGVLHSDDLHAPRHGYQVSHHFFDAKPDPDTHDDIIAYTFKGSPPERKQELSIFVAKRMIDEYKKDPEGLATYEDAVSELESLLQEEPASLTKLIRNKLYPDTSTEQILKDALETIRSAQEGIDNLAKLIEPTVIINMLDPKIPHTQAAQETVAHLRNLLSKKKWKLSEEELKTGTLDEVAIVYPIEYYDGDTDEDNYDSDQEFTQSTEAKRHGPRRIEPHPSTIREHVDKIHDVINVLFDALEDLREETWNSFVETLYGHPADDGGYYSSNYTEVTLMKECSMHLNHCGLMQLDISKEKGAYAEHYAPGKNNHAILQQELIMAFDLLGLHFLPETDFHNGRILFDHESSQELMNRGMHFSETYFKKLMQTSHRHRLFQPNTEGNTHPIQSFPKDPKNLLSRWANPDVDQAEEVAVRKLQIAP